MELICEYIKTKQQPEGFKITETKTGKYRVSKVKTEKEILEAKRQRLTKQLEEVDVQLKKFESTDKPTDEQA